ncbi:MAG TPA: acyl carrier protein [Candidatus Bathyarchaeia archaeon]|nr:acyl carrier protein [Candidatus Bathyarchaeia archaeon]
MSESSKDASMQSLIIAQISQMTKKPASTLKNDTLLLETGILDSLSLLKLVLFSEKQFGVSVPAEELVPDNFKTIDAMCVYLRSKQGK